MIKNSIWRYGKILVNYRGNSLKKEYQQSRLRRCYLVGDFEVADEVVTHAVVEFRLFDTLLARASVHTGEMYFFDDNKKQWLYCDKSFFCSGTNQQDEQFVILQGDVCYYHQILPETAYIENFSVTLIFTQHPEVRSVLALDEIEFDMEA
jgi:hypothetical protein